jgi:hypothetical protein
MAISQDDPCPYRKLYPRWFEEWDQVGRRAHFIQGMTTKEIVRDLRVSGNTVRKVVRTGADGVFRLILLIPSWDGLSGDPGEKRGPCD